MDNFRKIGVCMSVEIHFLRSDLDYFQENCGDFIEEQGERVHRDISDTRRNSVKADGMSTFRSTTTGT